MPTTFLENFDMLRKQTKKINLNPKIIFTAYAHFYDDFFKIWVAEKILSKSRYIICHHGGYVEKELTLICGIIFQIKQYVGIRMIIFIQNKIIQFKCHQIL